MNRLLCPKCGHELRIITRKIGNNKTLIRLECPNCGYFLELIGKEKGEKSGQQIAKTGPEDLPSIRIDYQKLPTPLRVIVDEIKNNPSYKLTFFDKLYGEPPEFGAFVSKDYFVQIGFNKNLANQLEKALRARGIYRLYKFQEEAIESIIRGKDTLIVAQTAMGKTEAFLLPALNIALESPYRPSVLIVYPTKALARDQLQKIRYYGSFCGVKVDVLDGDTPWRKRREILSDPPHILLTNFDMIHYWLPRLKKTRSSGIPELFLRARIIIIDEVHEYYGAFGTHVHYILQRIFRLAENRVQLVLASATISNPEEFATMLSGRNVELVMGKGRRVSLYVAFIYSFDSIFRAIARFLAKLVANKIKTLAFLNTRSSAELALNVIKRYGSISLKQLIELHRAGLSVKLRERIEEDFRRGRILGIISTPTLELGVDIGDVQAVISELVPVDRFIQRAGRAGRRKEPGTAILLLRSDDPISEYYARNPKEYFNDISARYLEPNNPLIAKRHLYLMAYEKKLSDIEVQKYPRNVIEELEREGALIRVEDGWIANGLVFHKYFSRNIRGVGDQIEVYLGDKLLDKREILIGIKELYPGAIYLNRGVKYIVREINLKKRKVIVERAGPEYEYYYTKPLYSYSAIPIGNLMYRDVLGTRIYYGPLRMTISVYGYLIFKEGERKPISIEYLDEPVEYEYPTFGMFFKAPPYSAESEEDISGAYHATEHILIEGTYRISGGSEYDLGGISYGTSGIIVIHEALPGGNGVAKLLFDRFEIAVKKAYEILTSPGCLKREHLNKCVFSYHCGNNNRPLNQRGAREILARLLESEKVPDAEKAPELLVSFEKGIV